MQNELCRDSHLMIDTRPPVRSRFWTLIRGRGKRAAAGRSLIRDAIRRGGGRKNPPLIHSTGTRAGVTGGLCRLPQFRFDGGKPRFRQERSMCWVGDGGSSIPTGVNSVRYRTSAWRVAFGLIGSRPLQAETGHGSRSSGLDGYIGLLKQKTNFGFGRLNRISGLIWLVSWECSNLVDARLRRQMTPAKFVRLNRVPGMYNGRFQIAPGPST
jgi:hypothetical protein